VDKTIRNSTAPTHAFIAAPRLGFWAECYSIARRRDSVRSLRRLSVAAQERMGLFGYVFKQPMWRCSTCGREFANRNQSHACGTYELEVHFRGKSKEIRALFDRVVAEMQKFGPVRTLPEKSRIAFQTRMSFAQVTPRQRWLDGHVVLAHATASKTR
jgi:hypothetical protein